MGARRKSLLWEMIARDRAVSALIVGVSLASTVLNSVGLTLLVPVLFDVFAMPVAGDASAGLAGRIAQMRAYLPGEGPLPLLLCMVVLFAGKSALTVLRVYLSARVGNRHLLQFRTRLLKHFLRKDVPFFQEEGSGALLNQLLLNVEKSSKVAIDTLESLGMIVQLLVYGVILTALSWQMVVVCVVLMLPALVGLRLLGGRVKRLSAARAAGFGALSQSVTDTIRGIRFVKLAGRERDHVEWVQARSAGLQRMLVSISFLSCIGPPITELTAVAIFLGFVGGMSAFGPGLVSITSFFTFLLILSRALPLFNNIVNRGLEIVANYGTLSEIERALADERWETKAGASRPVDGFRHSLRFEGLRFAYPSQARDVLQGLDFEIRQGESVAFVGPSGSGKSTLADLVLRFYEPSGGRIVMDGSDVRDLDLAAYRRLVGLVPQEALLFFSTLRENLSYFRPAATEDELWQALKQADLADFVASLPEGLDTRVGEGGVMLSGGQKQRLSIARTLLLGPALLIFDEATSSLDAPSEARIVEAIKAVSRGRTTITIAHRLATIMHCDRVFVFEAGRIVESGSPSELMRAGTRFRRLADAQSFREAA